MVQSCITPEIHDAGFDQGEPLRDEWSVGHAGFRARRYSVNIGSRSQYSFRVAT